VELERIIVINEQKPNGREEAERRGSDSKEGKSEWKVAHPTPGRRAEERLLLDYWPRTPGEPVPSTERDSQR